MKWETYSKHFSHSAWWHQTINQINADIVNWTLWIDYYHYWNKFQWNLNQNIIIFIQENAFENVVCKMAPILSQPQCVNHGWIVMVRSWCKVRKILYMIVHFSAHISKWELVCKFGLIFHIFIISYLGSRFHAWNKDFFFSITTFSYSKYFVHSYTIDIVFTLS